MPKDQRNRKPNVSWAQAVRDIVIASMNKGQLPILCGMFSVMIILWRLPPDKLFVVSMKVIELLLKGELWSYILLFLVCVGWFIHAKNMRRNFTFETNRITEEKSKLQNELVTADFKSSEK